MIKTLDPGEELDHYHIEGMVARGGMASIFRGIDTRSGRLVAIKVPHPEFECDPLFFDRFHREAEIGRKLDHPGVLKVLPKEDPSRIYIAMEWLEGKRLREILDEEKKLSPERSVRIALGICDALQYIHSHGIIHRDLKPENIMVGPDDSVKIIDFGLAGEISGRRLTFSKLTKSMGTPDYISPEQITGKRGDARSDVYSLGIILYEMLTGEVPFRGPSALAAMNQRLVNDPDPPSEINHAISPQLEEILWRALERDPWNRYPSARQFAWELRHPEKVGAPARRNSHNWQEDRKPKPHNVFLLVLIGMIPVAIFTLLLLVSRQH